VIRSTSGGVEISVRVIPRSRNNKIDGVRQQALLVRLTAPAVEGAANESLMSFLAEQFRLPRRTVRIVSGHHSRQKRVALDGVTEDQVRAIVEEATGRH
jgi:uncharacterized protein (TIGR00251 family)